LSGREIFDAVVLMAGSGSRLRRGQSALIKPLVPVLGRPLISYTFAALERAGVKRVTAVVGFECDAVMDQIALIAPPGLVIRFSQNPNWQKQNGISLLAAAPHVTGEFVLTMGDHLFDEAVLEVLMRDDARTALNLAVDRKLHAIFDIDDAMKVQTRGDRIIDLGKNLQIYDAIDTGVFVCSPAIFDHLERARQRGNGDCSLADGVRSMAREGKARALEIGDAWWQDVDTPEMLGRAEEHLLARTPAPESI